MWTKIWNNTGRIRSVYLSANHNTHYHRLYRPLCSLQRRIHYSNCGARCVQRSTCQKFFQKAKHLFSFVYIVNLKRDGTPPLYAVHENCICFLAGGGAVVTKKWQIITVGDSCKSYYPVKGFHSLRHHQEMDLNCINMNGTCCQTVLYSSCAIKF